MVNKCNADNVGYSADLEKRQGKIVDGIQYYDCSSLISAMMYENGFMSTNPWFATSTMTPYMVGAGWTDYKFPSGTVTMAAQNGDVLMRDDGEFSGYYGHTEMVYDAANGYLMGAHSANHTLADQVSIGSYERVKSEKWSHLFRYQLSTGSTDSNDFSTAGFPYKNNSGLTWRYELSTSGYGQYSEEAINNAKIIYYFLYNIGWSRTAIAAFLGNVQQECSMNPGSSEGGGGAGFGLVQWTPSTVLDDKLKVIYGSSSPNYDGTRQMNVIIAEYMQTNYRQNNDFAKDVGVEWEWINSDGSKYTLSLPETDWYDWAHDTTTSLENMVKIFMVSYERPAYDDPWYKRVTYANYWYDYFKDYDPPSVGGGAGSVSKGKRKKGMPLWMLLGWY
jgi:hypothetical protein